MRSYDSKEVLQYTGITRSQLTHWLREGVLFSRARWEAGTGHHRRFNFVDLVEAVIAVQQARRGTKVSELRLDLDLMRHFIWDYLATDCHDDWHRFRDPGTRPDGWAVNISITAELAHFNIFCGPAHRYLFPLLPHILFSTTTHLGNILVYLEGQTGDRWADGAETLSHDEMLPSPAMAYLTGELPSELAEIEIALRLLKAESRRHKAKAVDLESMASGASEVRAKLLQAREDE